MADRVAIFEPRPHIKGPQSWARHLRDGFLSLGFECDRVTGTKSGRRPGAWDMRGATRDSWDWRGPGLEVVGRIDDLHDVLAGYDLVITPEPKCPTVDNDSRRRVKLAKRAELEGAGVPDVKGAVRNWQRDASVDERRGAVPYYIDALGKSGRPWTFALHGGYSQYDGAEAPWLPELLQTPGFTGRAITHSGTFIGPDQPFDLFDSPSGTWVNEYISGVSRFDTVKFLVHRELPYTLEATDAQALRSDRRVAGFAGRMAPIKGFSSLASIARYLPPGWRAAVCGASQPALGPNYAHLLREALESQGWQRAWVEGGNWDRVRGAWQWDLSRADSPVTIAYRNKFLESLTHATREFGVFFNGTARSFSRGLMEFATLEALDWGVAVVVPRYMDNGAGDWRVNWLEEYEGPPKLQTRDKRTKFGPWPAGEQEAITKLRDACAWIEAGRARGVLHNRQIIREKHDPALLARRFWEECR